MTIEEILNSDSLQDLYTEIDRLTLENVQLIENIRIIKESNKSILESRGQLSINNNKLDFIRTQIDKINNETNRINHNFRMVAKKLLPKEKYIEIYELSQKSLLEAKRLINENEYNTIFSVSINGKECGKIKTIEY